MRRRKRIGLVGLYIETMLYQIKEVSENLRRVHLGYLLSDIVEEILFGQVVTH